MRNDRQTGIGSQVCSLFKDSRNPSSSGITAGKTSEIAAGSGSSGGGNFGNLRGIRKLHFRLWLWESLRIRGLLCFGAIFNGLSWESQQLDVFVDTM
jgi:hypothetical protein